MEIMDQEEFPNVSTEVSNSILSLTSFNNKLDNDSFIDDSTNDTETNPSNSTRILNSSNASVWSLDMEEEDWGDIDIPLASEHTLVLSSSFSKNNPIFEHEILLNHLANGTDEEWEEGLEIDEIKFTAGTEPMRPVIEKADNKVAGNENHYIATNNTNSSSQLDQEQEADFEFDIDLSSVKDRFSSITKNLESSTMSASNSTEIQASGAMINIDSLATKIKGKPRLITLEMMESLSISKSNSNFESSTENARKDHLKNSRVPKISETVSHSRSNSRLALKLSQEQHLRLHPVNNSQNGPKKVKSRPVSRQSSCDELDKKRAWQPFTNVSRVPTTFASPSPMMISRKRDLKRQSSKEDILASPLPSNNKPSTRVLVKRPQTFEPKIHHRERFSSNYTREKLSHSTPPRVAFGRTIKDVPKPRKPTLIRNIPAKTPKVIGQMVYDEKTKTWLGNNDAPELCAFEPLVTRKPTLIMPHQVQEVVGDMRFDPVKCVWVGNEEMEESHVFDEIEGYENAIPESQAAFELTSNLRNSFIRSETRHKLLVGTFYPQRTRFIRDTSSSHLWQILQIKTKIGRK